jgi:hypothetical protein
MGLCKLCRQERLLQHSHLIPRAFYRLLRTPGLDDPNPIVADADLTRASQEQLVQPLLCADCEGRLNRNGEHWVLSKSYRLQGPSPLYTALSHATPDPAFGSGTVYSALTIPGMNIDRLVYFGASIFWRAAVADWRVNRKLVELVRLGRTYEEQFRQYHNGEAEFPANGVLWVAVVRSEHTSPVISFPTGERDGNYHRHTFDVLGLSYILYVGSCVPKEIRRLCAVRSPERYMFFTDIDPVIDRNFRRLSNKSTPSSKLAAMTKKDLSEFPQVVRDQMARLGTARLGRKGPKSPAK